MKRISLIFAVLMVAFLAACGDSPTAPRLDQDKSPKVIDVVLENGSHSVSWGLTNGRSFRTRVNTYMTGELDRVFQDTLVAKIDNPEIVSVRRVGWNFTRYPISEYEPYGSSIVTEDYEITAKKIGKTFIVFRSPKNPEAFAVVVIETYNPVGKG